MYPLPCARHKLLKQQISILKLRVRQLIHQCHQRLLLHVHLCPPARATVIRQQFVQLTIQRMCRHKRVRQRRRPQETAGRRRRVRRITQRMCRLPAVRPRRRRRGIAGRRQRVRRRLRPGRQVFKHVRQWRRIPVTTTRRPRVRQTTRPMCRLRVARPRRRRRGITGRQRRVRRP